MKKLLSFLAVAAFASGYSSTWHEAWNPGPASDAGDLPATAHITQGTSALTAIYGSAGGANDVDVFKIKVTNPAIVNLSTVGGTTGDSILFVFDSAGVGVVANDDSTGLQSTIDATSGLVVAGDCYIAVSRYSRRASNGAGLIWSSFAGQQAPNGPGAAGAVTGWTNATTTAWDYTITCAGVDPAVAGPDETGPILASVTAPYAVVYSGSVTSGTVTLNAPAGGAGQTVNLSSSDPAATVPASVNVTSGNTTANFNITANAVGADTPVTITATVGSENKTANITVKTPPSLANSWIEDRPDLTTATHGDAGQTIGTAQMTVGTGGLMTIWGQISTATDVDIYCIKIVDPATFSASTVGNTTIDTQLFLFRADGTGIVMDDDDPAGSGSLQSNLVAGDPNTAALAPGIYYLAISTYDTDPVDTTPDELWLDTPFNVERVPDGPGMANPVDSWSGTGTAGLYSITLVGAEYCQAPEVPVAPTSLVPGPGTILSGGVTEISTSDNSRVNMRPGAILVATADPLVLQAVGTAPAATASSIKVQIETRATVSGIRQIVEARNFATASWTVLETFTPLPFGAAPDRAVQFTLTNPNNYIGPSNELRVRIRCKNTTAVLVYPWQVQFDEVTWRFTP